MSERLLTGRAELKSWLADTARQLGFDRCGIAPAELDRENLDHYLAWLEKGFHGEMGYMKRYQRQDLHSLLPSVHSVISVAIQYNSSYPLSIDSDDPARSWISRYAWGEDYHKILHERLERLVELLRAKVGDGLETKIYVDTGPVLERAIAWAAGLGWIAKNTCLIHEKAGSWFFLGEVLTNLALEPDFPAPDRCGTCTRCLEACPTGAIVEPYVLDATRCISYYTIEVKGPIPEPFRPLMGRHIFGCDICQDVCPWNRDAPVTPLSSFQPQPLGLPQNDVNHDDCSEPDRNDLPTSFAPPLEYLAGLSEQEFFAIFQHSPVRRSRYRGFLRNLAVAMGNSRQRKFRPVLTKLAQHPDSMVREHAVCALSQLPDGELADSES